jgi:hypothetical protein
MQQNWGISSTNPVRFAYVAFFIEPEIGFSVKPKSSVGSFSKELQQSGKLLLRYFSLLWKFYEIFLAILEVCFHLRLQSDYFPLQLHLAFAYASCVP